jgi:hypothetical protein
MYDKNEVGQQLNTRGGGTYLDVVYYVNIILQFLFHDAKIVESQKAWDADMKEYNYIEMCTAVKR